MQPPNILILHSSSANHLGLFNDIKEYPNVIVLEAKLKYTKFSFLQRIHLCSKFKLPFKYLQYNYSNIPTSKIKAVIVMGTALEEIEYSYLKKIKRKGGITILYLIDSLEASSPKIQNCKHKINKFKWDYIYTFDTTYNKIYMYDNECNNVCVFGGGFDSGNQKGTFKKINAIDWLLNV